jgi:ADP-heptose:LPS heptosyltransferase
LPTAVLKPDALGDFILASGTLRLLAKEIGEEQLVLVVRHDVAPLARCQFPAARVHSLRLRETRRVLNVTAVNLAACAPTWVRFCGRRYDGILALRSMRTYLHSFFFFGPPARRRVGCSNPLLESQSGKRGSFEKVAGLIFRPCLLPYPQASMEFPSELEANRRVVGTYLGRRVERREVLPALNVRNVQRGADWLLCPFSSTVVKDLPPERWAGALRKVAPMGPPRIRLAGSPAQSERLGEFAAKLAECGVGNVDVLPPCGVDDFAARVAESAMVLTVDTAAAHYACALDVPAVIASSGKHPGVYGPYSRSGRQIWLFPEPHAPGAKKGRAINWHLRLPEEALPDAIRECRSTS